MTQSYIYIIKYFKITRNPCVFSNITETVPEFLIFTEKPNFVFDHFVKLLHGYLLRLAWTMCDNYLLIISLVGKLANCSSIDYR